MLPDTDSLILFWSVARAQHQQHRMTTSWSAGGKARLPRSFCASVRGRSIRVGLSTTSARRTAGPSHRSNEDDSMVPPQRPLVPPHGQRLTLRQSPASAPTCVLGSMTR